MLFFFKKISQHASANAMTCTSGNNLLDTVDVAQLKACHIFFFLKKTFHLCNGSYTSGSALRDARQYIQSSSSLITEMHSILGPLQYV